MTGGNVPGGKNTSQYMIEFNSFNALQRSTKFDISIPDYLLEYNDIEYTAYMDGMVQIKNDNFTYKQCTQYHCTLTDNQE